MIQKFDVIVIRTGEAGSNFANKCRKAGWTVAIIDSRPYINHIQIIFELNIIVL